MISLPLLSGSYRAVPLLAVVSAGVVLAGCGSSGGGTSTQPASPQAVYPSAAAGANGGSSAGSSAADTVTATETEFHIMLSRQSVPAGTYTFQVANTGKIVHAMTITGPGVDGTTSILTAGQNGTVTVDLKPGSYDVFCPVDHHKAEGMDTTLTVT
jgi:uncharacterized cupredoxin-like copper-binding protein